MRNNPDECGIIARMVIAEKPSWTADLECELRCYRPGTTAEGLADDWRVLADYTSAFDLISRAKLEETRAICYSELFAGVHERATVVKLDPRKGQLLDQRIKDIGWPLEGWPKP